MSNQNNAFSTQQNALGENFISRERNGESDGEIAEAMLEFTLKRERVRHNVSDNTDQAAALDQATIEKMRSWDSDDPDMMVLEKVFRRIATGQGSEGITLLKKAIESKAEAISASQRKRASSPRRLHPVDNLIKNLVAANPSISCKELLRSLSGQVGKGVILDIDDDWITPETEGCKLISVGGLADRLSRVKKKIA